MADQRRPWQKSPNAPKRRTGRWLQARNHRIKTRDMWTCQACKRVTDTLEIDHIIPLHKGGKDVDQNCQSLCVPCHQAKSFREKGHKERQAIGVDGWPVV